jgi:hypothetical protein
MIFDIGGSFIKIYDSSTEKIIKIKMFEEPIISLKELKKILLNNLNNSIDYIGISSQMHGFILFDENNNNISDFITWKNYATNNILNENTFDEFKNTGLQKRNDLPINNLNDFLIQNNISNKKIHFKNITEGILDESFGITHDTMACGHGFYNIFSKIYIHEYIEYFKQMFNIDLVFDNVVNNNQLSGFIYYENKKIPVYVGLGDLQASINSFCFKKDFLLLNLATGSQIVSIVNESSNDINPNISYRPFFNNYLKCITHIPSGRFLNIYVDFFNEININFWDYINNLSLDDLYNSNLNIETDIFSKEGISISGIKYNLNLKNLISSVLYSYINQYITLIKTNNFTYNFILLSGGIGKKVKLIKLMIEKELHTDVIINDTDDDSLFGVIKFINK